MLKILRRVSERLGATPASTMNCSVLGSGSLAAWAVIVVKVREAGAGLGGKLESVVSYSSLGRCAVVVCGESIDGFLGDTLGAVGRSGVVAEIVIRAPVDSSRNVLLATCKAPDGHNGLLHEPRRQCDSRDKRRRAAVPRPMRDTCAVSSTVKKSGGSGAGCRRRSRNEGAMSGTDDGRHPLNLQTCGTAEPYAPARGSCRTRAASIGVRGLDVVVR